MKKNYCEILEDEALGQFDNCCSHPDFLQGALMPDAHTGYSLCIGGVVALKNTIVPAWCGYDLGCGMCAVNTGLKKEQVEPLKDEIFKYVSGSIPMGDAYNGSPYNGKLLEQLNYSKTKLPQLSRREAMYHIGTLGGGNHFIEIAYCDKTEDVWVVIHSGSRGIGWKIADAYMSFDKSEQGFSLDSDIGKQYLIDMNFCLDFALANRKLIMERVEKCFGSVIYNKMHTDGIIKWHELLKCYYNVAVSKNDTRTYSLDEQYRFSFKWDTLINRNHNHAEVKHGMVIHRKGATHAEKGMLGVIPGNMRDGSFIVEGLGNKEALWSSSHGAGRVLSRRQAGKQIDIKDFEKTMQEIKARVCEKTKDESPFAYKNIFDVMKIQEEQGMVKVLHYLKPIINFKG